MRPRQSLLNSWGWEISNQLGLYARCHSQSPPASEGSNPRLRYGKARSTSGPYLA